MLTENEILHFNKKASPDEEFELVRHSGCIPFDLAPLREAGLEDLDLNKFLSEFLPRRVSPEALALNGRSAGEWLEHLKFAYREGGRYVPTVAAVLLFGKQPQQYLPHSSIDFIRFEGEDPSYPIADRKQIEGALDHIIKTAVEMVGLSMVKSSSFSQTSPLRTDLYEYPLRAVREAVANAVVHRDYEFSRTQVSIKMFDNRIEILSPGGLFGIVTRENFGTGVNDYRNPTLAVALSDMGLVEKAGTGIFLIKRQMRENGSVEPSFEIGDKYLSAQLPAHPQYQAARLYNRGLHELESEAGTGSAAADLFKRALALYPGFAEAWAALGRMEAAYGNIEAARLAFQNAIDKNPAFEKAYIDWGKTEEANGNHAKAQTILRQGLQSLPSAANLAYQLGMLEIRLKNLNRAGAYLRQAVNLQPDNLLFLAALADHAARTGDWELALRTAQRALELSQAETGRGNLNLIVLKALITLDRAHEQIRNCFRTAYQTGFRAQEFFNRYYRYLTSKHLHAEALEIAELAEREGLQLTPPSFEVSLMGFPREMHSREVKTELTVLLQAQGLDFLDIKTHFDRDKQRTFAYIKTATEQAADRISAYFKRKAFRDRYLSVRKKQE